MAEPCAAIKTSHRAFGSTVAATPRFAKTALFGKDHLFRKFLLHFQVSGEVLFFMAVLTEYDALATLAYVNVISARGVGVGAIAKSATRASDEQGFVDGLIPELETHIAEPDAVAGTTRT